MSLQFLSHLSFPFVSSPGSELIGTTQLLLLLLLYYFAKPVQHHAKDPYIYLRLTTTPGSTTPTLYEQCVGSLTSHSINIGKDCETGPTGFRPYPRRLESLTICRCHYKGSTFFSVIVKTLSVGPAGA